MDRLGAPDQGAIQGDEALAVGLGLGDQSNTLMQGITKTLLL
jgi:hypothetical protein